MADAALIGRWNIVSWKQIYDDGRVTFPLGERLKGFISYDEQGQMTCMIANADRLRFHTGGQWNASMEERAAAYSGCLAYAGRYSVLGNVVTHHVDVSLFPNWEGADQRRTVDLGDDELNIVARLEEGTSEARRAVLAWKRAI